MPPPLAELKKKNKGVVIVFFNDSAFLQGAVNMPFLRPSREIRKDAGNERGRIYPGGHSVLGRAEHGR